jgi:hypothetical protein
MASSKVCLITVALFFALSVVPFADAEGGKCEDKMKKTDLGGELAN